MSAITIADLANAHLDVEHIAEIATSLAPTATDRKGNVKATVQGAVDTLKAFNLRGAWVTATLYALKDLYTSGGITYVAVAAHMSSSVAADLAAGKVIIHQGATKEELGAESGGEIVRYLPVWPGAAATALQIKAAESISLLEAGGADDWDGTSGTNNFAAFEKLCAKPPIRIRLPRTGTGVYMLQGITTLTNMAGVVLDPDEGVSLHVNGAGRIQASIAGIKTTRPMNVYYESGRNSQPLGPRMFEKPSEKSHFMSASDGELHKPIAIDFTTDAFNVKLSAWPNGVLTRYAPTAVATDSVMHPITPGLFAGTLVNVVPGDQIMAELSIKSHFPSVMIKTDSGWLVAWTAIGGTALNTMELIDGVGVNLASVHAVLANPSYNLDKCMLGVCIYDEQSFGLLVNGILIKRLDTDGKILAAGWSGGFTTEPFYVSNAVMFKGKRTAGLKPLKIGGSGDSTNDRKAVLKSAFEFAKQYLTGMGGCQVETLTNLAVAGNTSTQQLAALLATPVAGYDYWMIQVGINDIQTGSGAAILAANIESMVTYLRANNVVPIVGLPTMWYSQTSARAYGQDGAATNESNSISGYHYRLILLRKLAELGVYVNSMQIEDEGAVVASLLALPGGDPVKADNIHGTIYGEMLAGYSWAKAIASHACNATSDTVVPTIMDIGWFVAPAGGTSTPRYTVSKDGVFNTMWYLSRNAAAWADGDTIGTLPKRLRPPFEQIVPVVCLNSGTVPIVGAAYVKVMGTGVMKVYGVAVGTVFLSFSASWRI